MKRAIGLIAATLLTTSVYSQDYSSSYSQNPDSTPADYESRQSEAGAPATSESSSSSSSGYEVSPGASGGNSLTGQSSGYNIQDDQGEDKMLTTRDSDVGGSEYRGRPKDETQRSFDAEISEQPDASGSSATSESDSSSSSESEPLRGTGTADGAFHVPAAPVRESSESEGWSGSGTFSGAGPGSVSESESSELTPPVTESSTSFEAEVSSNEALENRDDDLSTRGLEPDSEALNREEAFSNSVEGDMDQDEVLIFEDWTIVEPDTNVGGPAGSDSGSSSSESSDSYSDELYQRAQRDWSARIGNTDVPATPDAPAVMDHELDHLRLYNSERNSDVGTPGRNESGVKSSDDDMECDVNKGSSAEYEEGELDNSVSSSYHINRGGG